MSVASAITLGLLAPTSGGGSGGSPPTAPTLVVADNGDGTGGVATISGGSGSATNELFYTTLNDLTTTISVDTLVGNGTIDIDLPVGIYVFQVEATTAGGSSFSILDVVSFTDTGFPIVERIFQTLISRLEAITVGNGYEQTVAAVLRSKSGTGITPDNLKVVVIQQDAEKNEDYSFPGNPPAQGWSQPFQVNLIIRPSEGSTTADDQTLNVFYADAVRAITTPQSTWHNWGGLAVNSELQSTASSLTDVASHLIRALLVTVYYRTNENDPYTER